MYNPTQEELDRIEDIFLTRPPAHNDQSQRFNSLREAAAALARLYVMYAPPSRERSMALTRLEESLMWANAGIGREG